MNRFGIKITKTYWLTLGLSSITVFAISILDVFFPSHLWLIAVATAMVFLGKEAAKSCCDNTNGYPFGRAFLWSFISYITGGLASYYLSDLAGWEEPVSFDYTMNTYSTGDADINLSINKFINFLQSPEFLFGLEFTQIIYIGVFISLITGAIIKINK